MKGAARSCWGAPLYMGYLHKDAQGFLSQQQGALAERSVAVFALGPLSTYEHEIWASRGQLDEELGKYPWLTPVVFEVFGGKYDPSKLGFSHRLLTALPVSPLHGLPASDVRDWSAIRAWASDLTRRLQPDPPD